MKKALSLLICFMLCFAAGCNRSDTDKKTVTLYFPDNEKKNMVSEERAVPDGEEDLLMFAVNALIKGPESEGSKKAMPDGTRILGLELSDNIATVNLSAQFNTGSRIDKLWSRYALINTLCDIKGVSKTQILVEGEVITSISSNEPLGPMGKDDIVTDITQVTNDTTVATLYFADENAMYLVPESREIVLKEGEKLETAVAQALFAGPKNERLYSALPQGVKVLSTETKDGICFLNLSAEFSAAGMGGSMEMLAVYSVVNTLCDVEGVEKVQILVEGKKIDEFGHLSLSESLERNKDVLKSSLQ